MGSALRGPASAIATPSDATLLMTLTTLREGTRSSAVRDLPARYPTRAAFGEPLKSGALLGRRIKYQSFDVLNRAAGFAAARHGRAAGFGIPRGRSAAQILFWSKALRPACSRSDCVSRPTCRRGGALAGHLLNAEDHRRREERLDRASLSASAVGISLRGRTER